MPGLDPASGLATAEGVRALRAALRAGPIELRARGASMRPLLRAGDAVRIERRRPRLGHVVLARVGTRLVLHRLVRRSGPAWLLRGDARSRCDAWIAGDDILGVVTARRDRSARRARESWIAVDGPARRWLGLLGAPALRCARGLAAPFRPSTADRVARREPPPRAAGRSPAAG